MVLPYDIYEQLIDMFNDGVRPVIKVKKAMCNEFCPLSPGMLARIVSVEREDVEPENYSLNLVLDASEFYEGNKCLFTHDYSNDGGRTYNVTAEEIGEYPKNGIIEVFVGVYKEAPKKGVSEDVFDIVPNHVVDAYKASDSKKSLVDWLIEEYEKVHPEK